MATIRGNSNGGTNIGPIGKVVQGLATGIGLAAEAYHHNKEKSRLKKEEERQRSQGHNGEASNSTGDVAALEPGQVDELTWELDEAQRDGTTSEVQGLENLQDIPGLAATFVASHPAPPRYEAVTAEASQSPVMPRDLALPVVLTQRRPKARERGFVRAYAPVLEEVGIDEPTFLEFVDKLNLAVQPSPWIQAINLASFAGMAVPEPFTFLISAATHMATAAATEVHSRSKTNTFLDQVNAEFFRPRGLFCLVLTWRPESTGSPFTRVDFEGQLAEAAEPPAGMRQKFKRNMQASSAAESFEWPDIAPLTFPGLEEAPESAGEKQQGRMKRIRKFVDDYRDKRALAEWAGSNPDSRIASLAPTPTFHSRFADPNHPVNSGHPLSLLTGGYINPPQMSLGPGRGRGVDPSGLGRGRSRGDELGGRGRIGVARTANQRGEGFNGRPGLVGMAMDTGLSPLSLITGAKKLLQKDILYLMIVNHPTDQEMADAARFLGQSASA